MKSENLHAGTPGTYNSLDETEAIPWARATSQKRLSPEYIDPHVWAIDDAWSVSWTLKTSPSVVAVFAPHYCRNRAVADLPPLGTAGLRRSPIERDRVEPAWFDHNTRFWYRMDLFDSRQEFVLVDAAKGTRQPAFDHARVAAALTRLTGKDVAADRLPIDALDFETVPGAILLQGIGQVWHLDPETYVITPHAGAAFQPPSLAPIGEAQAEREWRIAYRTPFRESHE